MARGCGGGVPTIASPARPSAAGRHAAAACGRFLPGGATRGCSGAVLGTYYRYALEQLSTAVEHYCATAVCPFLVEEVVYTGR